MKSITRIFTVFAVIISALSFFQAGINSVHHFYADMGLNLVVGGLWFAIIYGYHRIALNEVESEMLDREIVQLEKFRGQLDKIIGAEEARLSENAPDTQSERDIQHGMELREKLEAIIIDVVGTDRLPQPYEIDKIEAMFHATVEDHWASLTIINGSLLLQVSEQPFGTAGLAETAANAPKPPTKSQQRRANAKKGLGPITDDEVKAERAATRKAQRLAKKSDAAKQEIVNAEANLQADRVRKQLG